MSIFQLKQANQDLNSDLLVQNKKRETCEKELIKFEERYKADQKLNNDQMAKILKEMQDLEAKNKETVEKMKSKNITDAKTYQVANLLIIFTCKIRVRHVIGPCVAL